MEINGDELIGGKGIHEWPEMTVIAGEDLSAKQYHLVEINSDLEAMLAATAVNSYVLGVLQNSPAAGDAAVVRLLGLTYVVLDGTVTKGVIRPSTSVQGRVVAATSPSYAAGSLLISGADGEKQPAWFRPERPTPTRNLAASATQTGNGVLTETDLFSFSVPGATLAVDLETVEAYAAGTFSSSLSVDKQLRAYFGATKIFDTGALSLGTTQWEFEARVIRAGATTQKAICNLATNNAALRASAEYTTPGETLSSASTLRITGYGTLASDVVGEFWKVWKVGAA